jgi:replication-associated recombination protein RarA
MLLQEKYRPTTLSGLIGNKNQANEVLEYISSYYKTKQGSIISSGPTGTGKTLTVEIIAKSLGYELSVYDDVDTAISSMNQMSMFSRGKIVVLDLDCCTNLRNLKNLIDRCRHPLVMMTIDVWSNRYSTIRGKHKIVKYYKLNSLSLESFLKRVCMNEEIPFGIAAVKELAKSSDGDARFAMINLDSMTTTGIVSDVVQTLSRDGVYSVFDVMNSIFYGSADRYKLSSVDPFFFTEMMRKKVAETYKGEALAHALDCIAKADLFRTRIIRRQAWNLEKYWFDFITMINRR